MSLVVIGPRMLLSQLSGQAHIQISQVTWSDHQRYDVISQSNSLTYGMQIMSSYNETYSPTWLPGSGNSPSLPEVDRPSLQ